MGKGEDESDMSARGRQQAEEEFSTGCQDESKSADTGKRGQGSFGSMPSLDSTLSLFRSPIL
jgi:hypothetical protein